MNNKYEMVIGIEIHLELNTKSKLFSFAKNNFESQPNTNVSPIDLAFPGTLPSVNKEVIIKAIKLAKAFNMKIDNEIHFDRKNYFYTDIPKCFQITQQFRPIGKNGFIKLNLKNETKKININRIHIEEDTARQIHKGENTFLNYNRAGVPLIEIVSEPEISSIEEVIEYISNISLISKTLKISDAIMAKGSLRADINLSVKEKNSTKLGTKVEIKNLNSIANIEKAIAYEFNLQVEKLEKGEKINQETKRFSEKEMLNISMRTKDNFVDYKYFPEPNIPVIFIDQKIIDEIKIEELPDEIIARLENEGINNQFISLLIKDVEIRTYFDSIKAKNKNEWAKIFFADIIPLLKNKKINELIIEKNELEELLDYFFNSKINRTQLKDIILELEEGKKLKSCLLKNNENNSIDLDKIISDIIKQNENLKHDYSKNPDRCIKFVIGKIMQASKGSADPVLAKDLVIKSLEKNALK